MTEGRFLGITVLGDYVLNEGVEGVLANMEKCGATAVACNPTVTALAADALPSGLFPLCCESASTAAHR